MKNVFGIVFILALTSGCATTSGNSALTGAGIGAVGGAVAGHQQGKGAEGAAIGAIVGGLVGHAVGVERTMVRQYAPPPPTYPPQGIRVVPRHHVAPNPGAAAAYQRGVAQRQRALQRELERRAYEQGRRGY